MRIRGMLPRAPRSGRSELEKALRSRESVFVLFYADWCPFSMAFLPYFRRHAEGAGRNCVRITIDRDEDLFDKYGVEYMPTVIHFKNGKVARRLDSAPHVGLSERQLLDLLNKCK